MTEQQDLMESAGRNLAERIKAIKEGGDGYMTVMTAEETESFLNPKCSNLINGKCKINPNLPDIMGCDKGTMCGFHDFHSAE